MFTVLLPPGVNLTAFNKYMNINYISRRHKQLLDDLEESRGCLELKEEALDRTLWRARFGSGCGPVESLSRIDVDSGAGTGVSPSASVLSLSVSFSQHR